MDKILIRDLKIFAYHGVNPEEKRDGQNFVFDIKSNYFGNCYDSEYCIQGDLVHPNFDYGIVEEH